MEVGLPPRLEYDPCNARSTDLTLRQYVTVVPKLKEALRIASASSRRRRPEGVLINLDPLIGEAHDILEAIEAR